MKARISLLHNTAKGWSKLNFVPTAGELIIYDPDDDFDYARIKIGDGIHNVSELNFFAEATAKAVLKAHQYSELIDGGNILDYLN